VVKVVPPVLVICTVPTPSLAPSTDPSTVIAAGVPAEATKKIALELIVADVFNVTLFLNVAVLLLQYLNYLLLLLQYTLRFH
jgi:hypothetical protein